MDDRTEARVALRDLADAYAFACDTRDAERLRQCFADGATLTLHLAGRDVTSMTFPDAAEHITRTLTSYDRTCHFVGNHRAEVDGDDATGVTYCFAHHISGNDDHVMAIRYLDRYRRAPDGWRIVERHLHEDWTEARTVSV